MTTIHDLRRALYLMPHIELGSGITVLSICEPECKSLDSKCPRGKALATLDAVEKYLEKALEHAWEGDSRLTEKVLVELLTKRR